MALNYERFKQITEQNEALRSQDKPQEWYERGWNLLKAIGLGFIPQTITEGYRGSLLNKILNPDAAQPKQIERKQPWELTQDDIGPIVSGMSRPTTNTQRLLKEMLYGIPKQMGSGLTQALAEWQARQQGVDPKTAEFRSDKFDITVPTVSKAIEDNKKFIASEAGLPEDDKDVAIAAWTLWASGKALEVLLLAEGGKGQGKVRVPEPILERLPSRVAERLRTKYSPKETLLEGLRESSKEYKTELRAPNKVQPEGIENFLRTTKQDIKPTKPVLLETPIANEPTTTRPSVLDRAQQLNEVSAERRATENRFSTTGQEKALPGLERYGPAETRGIDLVESMKQGRVVRKPTLQERGMLNVGIPEDIDTRTINWLDRRRETWRVSRKLGLEAQLEVPNMERIKNTQTATRFAHNLVERIKKDLKAEGTEYTPESGERIFRYSVGAEIPKELGKITPAEIKAAGDIQAVLEPYKQDLRLSDKQIIQGGYLPYMITDLAKRVITAHRGKKNLFGKVATKDYTLPKELRDVFGENYKPEQAFFENLLQRKGGFPIKKDPLYALEKYIGAAEKYLSNQEYIKQVKPVIKRLPKESKQYYTDYIAHQVLERPFKGELEMQNLANQVYGGATNLASSLAAKIPGKTGERLSTWFKEERITLPADSVTGAPERTLTIPRFIVPAKILSRASSSIRYLSYLANIAMNTATGILNLTQPILGIAMQLSVEPLGVMRGVLVGSRDAMRALLDKEFRESLKDQGLNADFDRVNPLAEIGASPSRIKQAMASSVRLAEDAAFMNMTVSEWMNRAFIRGMAKEFMKSRGATEAAANDFAIRASDYTNYRYGKDFTPPGFASPLARITYTYNTFATKMLENMIDLAKGVHPYTKEFWKQLEAAGFDKIPEYEWIKYLPEGKKQSAIIWYMAQATATGAILYSIGVQHSMWSIALGAKPNVGFTQDIVDAIGAVMSGDPTRIKRAARNFIPLRRAYEKLTGKSTYDITIDVTTDGEEDSGGSTKKFNYDRFK